MLKDLPKSDDKEFWEGENQSHKAVSIDVCETHTKDNWMEHKAYIDNHDGTVNCKFCPWGTRLPGYTRCLEGKIIDLRVL